MTGGFFLENIAPLLILVAVWAYFKWIHTKADDPDVQWVGEVKGVAVDVVADEGRDRVGVTFPGNRVTVHALMSPQQARVLAEWLRIAGTSGRTLALARIEYQRTRVRPKIEQKEAVAKP
jgi:hypothetical protein